MMKPMKTIEKAILLSLLLLLSLSQSIAQTVHVVQRGETMESICGRYGITADELKSANPNLGMIFTGVKVNIPKATAQTDSKATAQTDSKATAKSASKATAKAGSKATAKADSKATAKTDTKDAKKAKANEASTESEVTADKSPSSSVGNSGGELALVSDHPDDNAEKDKKIVIFKKKEKRELTEAEQIEKQLKKERRKERWRKAGKIVGGVFAVLGIVATGVLAYHESMNGVQPSTGLTSDYAGSLYGGALGGNSSGGNSSGGKSSGGSSLPTHTCSMCNGYGKVFNPTGIARSTHNTYHHESAIKVINCNICGGTHCAQCNTSSVHKKCPKCGGKGVSTH